MNQPYQTAGFELPHISESDKLMGVLSSALENRINNCNFPLSNQEESYITPNLFPSYWSANHFNLHKVKLFKDATQQEQVAIRAIASQSLLEEAYFIEKAGVGYMAKMVMLAETTEERMLYALFSADETYHLAQIMRFLPQHKPVGTDDAFLRFLADLIEYPDKTVILFVLQVVLEGWGLSHYRSLAKDCQDKQLGQVLTSFLQDESRHHATGVTLFKQSSLSPSSEEVIIEALATFLQMIQAGPQRIVAAIEQVLGHLSRSQKVRLFEELDTETHSGTRLALLRSLMGKDRANVIIEQLEARDSFQPFPAYMCV